MKPVLFVTGHAPAYRIGAFARLHEREDIELALFGGRSQHGGGAFAGELPFPHRYVRQHEPAALAASGDYRAVVCSAGGRVALPAAWAGARRGRVPLILWSSLWAHPRSPAHAFSYLALRLGLYRSADAIVTYGPHVSAYVRARGARNVHVAPQSVDNDFWNAPATAPPSAPYWPAEARAKFLFAGRPSREKGLGTLIEAWRASGLQAPTAALVLAGVGPYPPWAPAGGAAGVADPVTRRDRITRTVTDGETIADGAYPLPDDTHRAAENASKAICLGPISPEELRNLYAAADVLVIPSIATRTFREPWGLVVNEAMNQGLAVIASDAVGAAAGGLVRDEHNGLIVPAGDSVALTSALARLAGDAELRARLGRAGAQDVRAYSHAAWAEGFSKALSSLGLSRRDR
jgi:glycosyltransferase involved in cell wall biosynthesis